MNNRFVSLVALFVIACNSAEYIGSNAVATPDALIAISTTAPSFTKGELVGSTDDMLSIGLYCEWSGGGVWSKKSDFSKLQNVRFYRSNEGVWTNVDGGVSWGYDSLDDNYTFFSYSPHVDDAKGLTTDIVKGELVVNYIVPSSSVDQPDLMIAEPQKDISPLDGDCVPLNFFHALASLRFSLDTSDAREITAITLNGVIGDGSLSWNYDDNELQWSLGDLASEPFTIDIDYTPSSGSTVQVNSKQGYLMMIPQSLPNGAEVEVTIDGTEKLSLTIPAGSEWVEGVLYNYVITLDDGDGDGDDDGISKIVFTSEQLSNCYIINPPTTTECMVQIPIEDRINDFWQNYSGKKSKKIKNKTSTDSIVVDMVWRDFSNEFLYDYDVVENDDSENKMAVQFTITSPFQEGNFIFMVSLLKADDEGEISKTELWSWHLWFTEYNPDKIAEANILNIVPDSVMAYTASGYSGEVHRYKDADDATKRVWSEMYSDKFIMDRNIGERNILATNYGAGTLYYQFGRKDPFPGSGGTYADGGSQPGVRSTSSMSYIESIMFCDDYAASPTSSSGNWSDDNGSRDTLAIWFDSKYNKRTYDEGKSIFDPSPLGWRVPVSATWSSLNSSTGSGDVSSVGKYFYYGYKDPYKSGGYSDSEAICYVWGAEPESGDEGHCLSYSESEVSSSAILIMSYGLPVRAIQE